MDGRPECAPPIVHMRIAPPTEHPVPAWQITPWLQIHGITCHPASRVEFFSSLLELRRRPRGRERRRRRANRGGGACRLALGQRGTCIALMKVAIGKAQAGYRATEGVIVDPLHPEARLDRQTGKMRAYRGGGHPDGAWRQRRKLHRGAARRPDRADNRTIAEDASESGRAVEAVIGKQLAGNKGARLIGRQILGESRTHTERTYTRNNYAEQHLQPPYGRELDINETS